MKKIILFTSLLGAISLGAQAQNMDLNEFKNLAGKEAVSKRNLDTVAWIYGGTLAIGFNQGLLHNWAAGGELTSITANGVFNGHATRYNNRHIWTNNLDANYGLFYAYSNKFVPRKTDDRVDLTSKYGYKLSKKTDLYFTALFNAKSQFTKAYNYDLPRWDTSSTSRFLSPLYATLAPGLEYRRGSELSVFFSPVAARFTHVSSYYTNRLPEGAFGVKNGQTARFEIGAYMTARYTAELIKPKTDPETKKQNVSISYRGRLDLYSNYLAKDNYNESGEVVKRDNPGNIDIMWDNFLSFKFFKYFSLNIGATAIYDNDVPYYKYVDNGQGQLTTKDEPFQGLGWWQVKQTMNIGFNYKF